MGGGDNSQTIRVLLLTLFQLSSEYQNEFGQSLAYSIFISSPPASSPHPSTTAPSAILAPLGNGVHNAASHILSNLWNPSVGESN